MTQRNVMAEDMFEKARTAFFGAVKISPQKFDELTEFLTPRDKPTPNEVATSSRTTTK